MSGGYPERSDRQAPPTRVFVASRARLARFLLLALIFVAGGVLLGLTGSPTGWLGVAFFGLGAVVFSLQLIRPGRLELSAQGFQATTWPRRPVRRTWVECGPFRPWKFRGTSLVVYPTSRTDRRWLRSANRFLTRGADGSIQANYRGISPLELVALMNDYQQWALRHPEASSPNATWTQQ